MQAVAGSWDSLCLDTREQVFAALSLLDLGRAAPTCRDFRAAHKARLSAAHPAAVEAGVSLFGEAFLRAHSTLLSRFSRRMDVFSGGAFSGGFVPEFHILGNGKVQLHSSPAVDGRHPASRVVEYWRYSKQHGTRPYLTIVGPLDSADPSPYFGLTCRLGGGYLHICVACDPQHCTQAAGAFAAVCEYLQADQAWLSRQGQDDAWKVAVEFAFTDAETRWPTPLVGHPTAAQVVDIAAAVLPLSHLAESMTFFLSPPDQPDQPLVVSSLGKLEILCRGT